MTYDVIKELCKRNNISVNKLEQDLGFAKGSLCRIDVNKPSMKKIQRLSAYFSVSLDCFAPRNTGENQDDGLSQRDKRDIAKDLDKIMYEIRNGEDGPLYYNGEEIGEASINLLQNAIEYALNESKKENKVKYNPNKNKK